MLAEKTLDKPTIDMRLVDQVDKLERLLLSDEEIAALEKLSMPGMFESATTQRWFANCGGCGGCRGCRGCGGCGCRGCGGCRPCRGCGGCGGCKFSDNGTASSLMEDSDDIGFGY
jgi:hypothetical protein